MARKIKLTLVQTLEYEYDPTAYDRGTINDAAVYDMGNVDCALFEKIESIKAEVIENDGSISFSKEEIRE